MSNITAIHHTVTTANTGNVLKVKAFTYYVSADRKRVFLVAGVEGFVPGKEVVALMEWGKGRKVTRTPLKAFEELISNNQIIELMPEVTKYQF